MAQATYVLTIYVVAAKLLSVSIRVSNIPAPSLEGLF
jgi:hypothetical protein